MSSQVAVIGARDDSETGSAVCVTGEAAIRVVEGTEGLRYTHPES